MIVPKYWAEGRAHHREKGKQVTVRRYGWSDASQADAQTSADARAQEALARVLSGEKLHRRDHKVAYNGAEGLPIREEILSTHGDAVITRNSYGAHCLNTPNVLFADVDFGESLWWKSTSYLIAAAITMFVFLWMTADCCEERSSRFWLFVGTLIGTAIVCRKLSEWLRKLLLNRAGGAANATQNRIRGFAARHPDWGLRVYRTPAGFRVVASHATFTASQPEVAECFSSLRVDRIYVRMCLNQQCFRARLTAKPWRMGMSGHMRPRPGVWPIKPEQVPVRAAWVAEYERVANGFAACRFIEKLGNAIVHPDVRSVIELHDAQSRAHSELPLA
ncbi:MAG TPA: hypothetical protein VEW08_07650 [Steroidobacteraceae bacterium]|nr:hypothetical protein [Steroidobacteraceae bacterium]